MGIKVFLTSSLVFMSIVTGIATYKAYVNTDKIKVIQENITLLQEIKTLISQQYQINPDKITRQELIALLPKNGHWDKLFLLNRNESFDTAISDNIFLDPNGLAKISSNDKISLLAFRKKLKSNGTTSSDKVSFNIISKVESKNYDYKLIEEKLQNTIDYLVAEVIYQGKTLNQTKINTIIADFTPSQIKGENKAKKQANFKKILKEKLKNSKKAQEGALYLKIKDNL